MELSEFNRNSVPKRAEIVWDSGSMLCVRCTDDASVLLYNMGKFFAEVWYNPAMNNIIYVKGFKSINCLEPYLELISLDDLN
ncbi:hypothetical protein [Adhaeribacter aquaticus]|uniref:hypothetical protein n=1 Tax=Adhaeribacter aquaticus TaxID=299567 RepID=UPI00040EE681|nr:hypothetical protein [Adhaeribacter aquaticus]